MATWKYLDLNRFCHFNQGGEGGRGGGGVSKFYHPQKGGYEKLRKGGGSTVQGRAGTFPNQFFQCLSFYI